MIDILENIDDINNIVQDCINNLIVNNYEFSTNKGVYRGYGYSVDITETRKNIFRINVRTDYLQDLCVITLDKNGFVHRYNHKFMFCYNKKNDLFLTNLFDDHFALNEIEPVFFMNNVSENFQSINFDFINMITTLNLSRSLYEYYYRTIIKNKSTI